MLWIAKNKLACNPQGLEILFHCIRNDVVICLENQPEPTVVYIPVTLLKLRTYRAVSDDLLSQEDPNIPPTVYIYRNTTMTHEVATIADSHEISHNHHIIPRAIIVITWSSEKKSTDFLMPKAPMQSTSNSFWSSCEDQTWVSKNEGHNHKHII